eukprot:2983614-Prymnesium_polylepis.2
MSIPPSSARRLPPPTHAREAAAGRQRVGVRGGGRPSACGCGSAERPQRSGSGRRATEEGEGKRGWTV